MSSGWNPGLKHCLRLPEPSPRGDRREKSTKMIRNNLALPDTLHETEKEGPSLRLLPKVEGGGLRGGGQDSESSDGQTDSMLGGRFSPLKA